MFDSPNKTWEFVPDNTQVEVRRNDVIQWKTNEMCAIQLEELFNRTISFDWRTLRYLTPATATRHMILSPNLFSLLGFVK